MNKVLAFWISMALLGTAGASAQLPQASAATLDLGYDPTASAGGFAAIASNPAGLARPGAPSFSLALPGLSTRGGLGPVTLRDLSDWDGRLLSDAVKNEWMTRVIEAGGQSGGAGAAGTALAVTMGPVGLQVSARAGGGSNLSPDAVELVLYGNAGRSGQPRDFDLADSKMEGFVLTTVAASYGVRATESIYLGLTGKFSIGNGLVVGRDAGSFVAVDPISVELDFPILVPYPDGFEFNNGSGIGMDLGGIWDGPVVRVGLTIENVFNTFEWNLDSFSYVAGQALFDADQRESDLEERRLDSAPAAVRDEFQALVDDYRPERRLTIGASTAVRSDIRLFANLQRSLSDGMSFDPDFFGGVGAEWTRLRVLPLRAHAAVITDGFQLGGGGTLVLGPVHMSAGMALRSASTRDSLLGTFTLSFGSH